MKIYAFIFARGGSKGVPGKNIKLLAGKPLLAHAIELANKISSQTVDIYNSAKKAQDSFKKTSDGIMEVMDKIKDGKGSLLSKTSKINKIGGLTPKKLPPFDVNEDDDEDKNE